MAEPTHTHHKAAGGGLTKKMGPLPVWAWGLIIGVGVFFLYERYAGAASTSTTATDTSASLDPNAVDPNTGLTYGTEEQDAENSAAAGVSTPTEGSLGSSGGTTSTGQTPDDFDTDLNNMEGLLGFIQSVDPNFGQSPVGTGSTQPTMTSSTPPPTTPTAHTPIASPLKTTAGGTVGMGHTEGKLPTTATSAKASAKAVAQAIKTAPKTQGSALPKAKAPAKPKVKATTKRVGP